MPLCLDMEESAVVTKNKQTKEKIKKYIQANISTVSLSNICDAFGIDLNELYKIFEETTPGEIIRAERIKIVKRMRREWA